MNWIDLNSPEQLEKIKNNSEEVVVIFKHSTRCPVSSMAKRSLEFEGDLMPKDIPCYYLDLIRYRDISNTISQIWSIKHESPQLIIVKGNQVLYHASHSDIEMRDILNAIN